jgi:hypothetical protein
MWWLPIASAVAGGYMGYKQQQAQDRARKEQALINMYSPIFGSAPQALPMEQNYQNPGAIQGLLTGYSLMTQLEDRDAQKAQAAALAAAAGKAQTDKTDVFVPYAVQDPTMSQGAPDVGPYSYKAYNPFQTRNPFSGG